MNILVESKKKNINEVLLAYSTIPLFKQKYPFAHITFGCNEFDTMFFRRSGVIDQVNLQSFYGQAEMWTQHDLIVSEDFGLDKQWNPQELLGDLDIPDNWTNCPYGLDFKFTDFDYMLFNQRWTINKERRNIGIFYTIPKDDPTWEMFHVHPKKWECIINSLNEKHHGLHFYFFTALAERANFRVDMLNVPKKNVSMLGAIDSIKMAILSDKLDLVIGAPSGIMSTFLYMFNVDRVVLSTKEDTGQFLWSGIPDQCCMPHKRFQTFANRMNGSSNTFYIYPTGRTIEWDTEMWDGTKRKRNMLSLNGIDEVALSGLVLSILDHNEPIGQYDCEICLLKQNNECLYWWNSEKE